MHVQSDVFDYYVYTEEEYHRMQAEDDAAADILNAWQYNEEVIYRSDLECSYPQDATALAAAEWLNQQGL